MTDVSAQSHAAADQLRPLEPGDGLALYGLIRRCPPLDLNSPYAYHLLAHHFGSTCRGIWRGQKLVAAATGYRLPQRPQVFFLWQIAVDPEARGQGLGGRLLDDLMLAAGHWRHVLLQTTIGPENLASRALFEKWAGRHQQPFFYQPFLAAESCGPGHDAEELLSIGPVVEGDCVASWSETGGF